jgi:hypothetical protein
MASRNALPVEGANIPGLFFISARLTFAADVAANGVAVTKSNGFVSSCTRTAEGIFQVTFADTWYRCLGMLMPPVLTANLRINMTAQSVADSTPTVDFTVETGSTGGDIDPDGLTLDVVFVMKNSSVGEQA